MKGLKIIVLAKQVPDTRNVGQDAMKEDGTINRGALPAVYNPEDLHALEQALRLKDKYTGTTVHIVTMGPPRAAEIIRESMYRGADGGYLITDRAFAGADTLATSYTIAEAIKKIGGCDVIIAGRQAIDGDTAQVGPQVAEKLNIPQITYAEDVVSAEKGKIVVKRRLERGVETVESPMPAVLTVTDTAPHCRTRNAIRVMKFKHAKTTSEMQTESDDYLGMAKQRPYLTINEWTAADLDADPQFLGLTGSPTKVKTIQNVVLTAKEAKKLTSSDGDINTLIMELVENHTLG